MIKNTVVVCAAILMLLGSNFAEGNDGFAALGVGGIVISKTDAIAMDREILDIAYDKIKVKYDFINESDKDITSSVMFPLPTYPANPSESGIISHGQPSGFSIKSNGQAVSYRTKVIAKLGNKDVTKILVSAGSVVVNKDVAFPMRRRLELSDSSEPIYWDSKRPPLADSSFCNGLTIVPAWQPSPLHRPQLAC